MIPTPGRIVEYTLTEHDAQQINNRRKDATVSGIAGQNSGAVVHFGNAVREGETYPMVIVRAWGQTDGAAVNGQVFLDGNDTFWALSRNGGENAGQWRPFPRV